MRILFSNRIDKNNVGDYWSSPFHYYRQYLPNQYLAEKLEIKKIKSKILQKEDPIILGGGGLIGEKKFDVILRMILTNSNSHCKVLWGVGDNVSSMERKSLDFLSYIQKYDLVGIRDYIKDLEHLWVPCASCKSSYFDKFKGIESTNDIVYFQHLYKPFPQDIIKKNPGPLMTNNGCDFENVLRFLASGEYVITNSYHGAYWAQLLGKRVIVTPWSTKFLKMKYPVVCSQPSEWFDKLKYTKSYEILEECREANDNFFKKILSNL